MDAPRAPWGEGETPGKPAGESWHRGAPSSGTPFVPEDPGSDFPSLDSLSNSSWFKAAQRSGQSSGYTQAPQRAQEPSGSNRESVRAPRPLPETCEIARMKMETAGLVSCPPSRVPGPGLWLWFRRDSVGPDLGVKRSGRGRLIPVLRPLPALTQPSGPV